MKIIHPISMKKAYRRELISHDDFLKCFVCSSAELTYDKNQEAYTEDICGTPTFVEGGIVCKKCHTYQGYISYGQVMPCYVKEAKYF